MATQPKPCDLCGTPANLRYRIQHESGDRWVLACPACQQRHSQNNPHYRYGGTWKARRKKG
jgi:hypothetical protein